ncbi:porin family protein [Shewanella sp. P1-14-1]|uniref:porin family protein n=1 Tax=Shewanella sp. P1-14-1 TaxID=1723761 RepID=UPI001F41E14F|nr:porin family protein [Shewanella sp. P1-14-1]
MDNIILIVSFWGTKSLCFVIFSMQASLSTVSASGLHKISRAHLMIVFDEVTMMKINTILAATLCSSLMVANAQAADVDYFIGAGTGYQTDTINGDVIKDTDGLPIILRAGVVINEQHRVTGTFSYMEDKFSIGEQDYKHEQYSWLVSYDYLIPVAKNTQLFMGVTAGGNDNKVAGKASADFTWGGQAGVTYQWNEHFSSDLGYRYLEQDYSKNGVDIDNSQQVYLTLDYKF